MEGGAARCTFVSLPPCPSLVKEAELQTQILQKINKPHYSKAWPHSAKGKAA